MSLPTSEVLVHPLDVEPANLLISLPELGSLVDIDLAGLLSIRFPELLVDPGALQPT